MHKFSLQQRQAEMRQRWGPPLGAGRPRLDIDRELVFELALMGYNNSEIARCIPCDRKTLRRFAPELERARARHAAHLKIRDFQAAMDAGDREALRRCFKQITNNELRSQRIVRSAPAKQQYPPSARPAAPAPPASRVAAESNAGEPHHTHAPAVPAGSVSVNSTGLPTGSAPAVSPRAGAWIFTEFM